MVVRFENKSQQYPRKTEQEPVTITVIDIQQRLKNIKIWTAPDPDMIHTHWLKKLACRFMNA